MRPREPGGGRARIAGRAGRVSSRPMAVERSLILAKPDAVARGLAGEIVGALRAARRRAARRPARRRLTRSSGRTHYAEHREKPFFPELVDFITSGPDARLRARGRGRDRDGAPDDRRDQPSRGRPRVAARKLRARDAQQPRSRLGLRRGGRARDRALVPRWARLSRPAAHSRGLRRWLLLASTSPQRRAILTQLRVPFEAVAPAYDGASRRRPARACRREGPLGGGRRTAGARRRHGRPALRGSSSASPRDADEARAMLEALSGASHEVVSGLCLRTSDWEEAHRRDDPGALPPLARGRARSLRRPRRVGGTSRRLRDPGTRSELRRADRGRLPQRGRASRPHCSSPLLARRFPGRFGFGGGARHRG